MSDLSLTNVEALAGEPDNICNDIEKTLTGASMYVTKITGEAAAGIEIGTKFNSNWSAEIKGAVEAESSDEYKIECYVGGSACCTPQDWKQCASGGCPKAGVRKS
jgi:hypothetical protein